MITYKDSSETTIFETLRITRVISGKKNSLPEISRAQFPSKLRKVILKELFS